jgi:hypothetical protein
MVNENQLQIKERKGGLFIKGIGLLLLMVGSLFVAFLPFLEREIINRLPFYIVGGCLFCLSTVFFIYLLYKECDPDNIFVLNSHGFVSPKIIGNDIEIEWTNVSHVQLLGSKESPYFGITLENPDIVMALMKKKRIEEMRENIENELPHILVSQKQIRYSANQLKDLFVRFVREARLLENDIPKKPKSNPFTTEDVLRAFGQLNDEPAKEEIIEVSEESDIDIIEEVSNEIIDETPITTDEADEPEITPEANDVPCKETASNEPEFAENPIQSSVQEPTKVIDEDNYAEAIESFYDLITSMSANNVNIDSNVINEIEKIEDFTVDTASESIEESSEEAANDEAVGEAPTAVSSENVEEPDMSDEMLELLSKARSSRITELEKLLNSDDVPFSAIRTNEHSENEIADGNVSLDEDFPIQDEASEEPEDISDTKEFIPLS